MLALFFPTYTMDFYLWVPDKETKEQRGKLSCSRSHGCYRTVSCSWLQNLHSDSQYLDSPCYKHNSLYFYINFVFLYIMCVFYFTFLCVLFLCSVNTNVRTSFVISISCCSSLRQNVIQLFWSWKSICVGAMWLKPENLKGEIKFRGTEAWTIFLNLYLEKNQMYRKVAKIVRMLLVLQPRFT